MIRSLTLDEVIKAAKSLDSAEQIPLVAAISDQLRSGGCHVSQAPASGVRATADDWTALAIEGLSRAYGDSEPEYSAEDLVP
jgi:hypothetical protein